MPSFMIDEKKNLVESQGFLLDERKNLVKDQGYVIDEKKNLVEYQGGGGEVNPPITEEVNMIKNSLILNGLEDPNGSITISNGVEFINSLQNIIMATLTLPSGKTYNSTACTVISMLNLAVFEFAHTNSNGDVIQINITINNNTVRYNSGDYDTPTLESSMTLNVYLES